MTGNPTVGGAFRVDVAGGMIIEWDVPIKADDGNVLRADVFRPAAPGIYPVILSYGPYGKGRPFQVRRARAYQKMVADYPEVAEGTSGSFQVWEVVDPEKWVLGGYVCVRVDSRGAGRSPGFLEPFSGRETRDIYGCIEWAGTQPWSSGKVGLCGISYFAVNAWRVAAMRPPHLAAVCAWEGATDYYRDITYHGGIFSIFQASWYGGILAESQYGLGEKAGHNPITGQAICGDETLSAEELATRRLDLVSTTKQHPLLDEHHRSHIPDLSHITVPLLSAGNWGGQGLHMRGNTRGFELAGSSDKWLEMHDDTHFSLFYAQYGLDLQKRFFGHFLKGEDTGWDKQPRVHLRTRHADGLIGERASSDWPLPETQWTRLYLDAGNGSMRTAPTTSDAAVSYMGKEGRVAFSYVCPEDLELAGPVAAKLYIESSTTDTDLFLVVRAFAPDGTEIVYQGANDPHVPIAQGWLRASHRALDLDQSRPFLPVHQHERIEPLEPGMVYEVDVEIWPTSLILPAGYTLTLDVQAHDYVYPGAVSQADPKNLQAGSGSGPFLHNDPDTRPDDVYGGTVTLHTGPDRASYLMIPAIPD
jgi:uncharacterized protein